MKPNFEQASTVVEDCLWDVVNKLGLKVTEVQVRIIAMHSVGALHKAEMAGKPSVGQLDRETP